MNICSYFGRTGYFAKMPGGDTKDIGKRVEGRKLMGRGVFPPKSTPGTRKDATLPVLVNVWGISPASHIPFYRYDFRVFEEYPPKKDGLESPKKEVTKQTRNDFMSIDRKNKCVEVYRTLLKKEKTFFGDISSFVYDRASILYSLDKLDVNPGEVKTFYIQRADLSHELFSEECVRVEINIKQCVEDFQLTSTDFKSDANVGPNFNKSLVQFYELLLSQEAFFTEGRFVSYGSGEFYLLEPENFRFGSQDTPSLPDGKFVGVGATKRVKFIEGPENGVMLSMSIDVKKAAFHVENQDLVSKVAQIFRTQEGALLDERQIKVLKKMMKGLFVRCSYGKLRTFRVDGIAHESAEKMRLQKENKMITVVQYFAEQYGIQLKYGRLPLVVEKTSKGLNYYPMELLHICENQRVTLTQQSSAQVQQMIRACAIPPAVRIQQMHRMMNALKLDKSGRENRWCKEFQIELTKLNLEVEARVLHKPTVIYGDGKMSLMKDTGAWSLSMNTKYLIPANCEKWIVVALVSANDRFNKKDLDAYVRCFMTRCNQRGMTMKKPLIVTCIPRASERDIKSWFDKAQESEARFIHFITSENLKFHEKIKFLESQYQILTQDLLTKNAAVVQYKSQTMDNIVHKTNLKLGGLNFELRLESPSLQPLISRKDRLIIGMDLAFCLELKGSKDGATLSSVGYCSNCRLHPLEFIGGYRYAWTRKEELCEGENVICDLVAESLVLAKKNRNVPVHIIMFRDGISEGSYKYVVEREVEQIKKGCAAAGGPHYRPHITFVVVTKKHNLRIYRKHIPSQARVPEQNIPPGTVLDREVTDAALNEFYLNSHTALQGTSRTPRYNLVFDTSHISADELQALAFALTFNLQIVNQACSIPAPLMVADRMSARGRLNLNIFCGETISSEEVNLEHLNAELGYMGKPLANTRFNA